MGGLVDMWRRSEEEVLRKWSLRGEIKRPSQSKEINTEEYTMLEIEGRAENGHLRKVSEFEAIEKYVPYVYFNKMQSAVVGPVLEGRENVLLCAPTGTGKSEIGILAILKEYIEKTGKIKVVYTAPTKTLVKEIERKIRARFPFIQCASDTSDTGRIDHQKYQVIVTTPEKMEILGMKRKIECTLLIIDEMHLLNEERGGVIESIVIRAKETPGTRIIGMSASIPNYQDVGEFIGAEHKNTFYFGAGYREVPVTYRIYGLRRIPEKSSGTQGADESSTPTRSSNANNASRSREAIDNAMFRILEENIDGRTLVFTASKEEARSLAQRIARSIEQTHTLSKKNDTKTNVLLYLEKIKKEKENAIPSIDSYFLADNNQHILRGVGVHHSGLPHEVRAITENMFEHGAIKLLCATETLAWGVNLPIDTVIIYGTSRRRRENGPEELSLNEVSQMCGRSGRKPHSTKGTAVIITTEEHVGLYSRSHVFQFPVESTLARSIDTRILYEIGYGTETIADLVAWFKKSFSWIRCKKHAEFEQITQNPEKVLSEVVDELKARRLVALSETSRILLTERGKICFRCYIDPETVDRYATAIEKSDALMVEMDVGDALAVLSTARDFDTVRKERSEETKDLEVVQRSVPYPVNPRGNFSQIIGQEMEIGRKVSLLVQGRLSKVSVASSSLSSAAESICSAIPRLAHALLFIASNRQSRAVYSVASLCRSLSSGNWCSASPNLPPPFAIYAEEQSAYICLQVENSAKKRALITAASPSSFSLVFSKITFDEITQITLPTSGYYSYRVQVECIEDPFHPLTKYFTNQMALLS